MKIIDGMVLNKVGDKYIAVPTGDAQKNSNSIVRLNDTGYAIWKGIEKGLTVDEIVKQLADEYDAGIDEISTDVNDIIKYLSDKGYITD